MISLINLFENKNVDHLELAARHYVMNFPHVEGIGISELKKQGLSDDEIKDKLNNFKNKAKEDLKKELNEKDRRKLYSESFNEKGYKDKGFNSKQIEDLRILHKHMNNFFKSTEMKMEA